MTKLSKYLTVEEATKSHTAIRLGIDNTPTDEQLENMKYVAAEVFDPVREFVGAPLGASSFFRCWALNGVIGGASTTSQHPQGQAIDIDADIYGNSTNLQIFNFIKGNLVFDQLIGEYPDALGNFSWVHVSLKRDENNRKEILVKLNEKYIPFKAYKVGMI
jgi:hypothetical protein